MGNDVATRTPIGTQERFYASRRRGGRRRRRRGENSSAEANYESIKRGAFTGLTLKGGVNVRGALEIFARKNDEEQLKAREASKTR